jgi:hypothetical protein
MTTESKTKSFDTVAWVRSVRDRMYEEHKNISPEQLLNHINAFSMTAQVNGLRQFSVSGLNNTDQIASKSQLALQQ